MPIYLFEPDKPMREVYSLPNKSAVAKSYAYAMWADRTTAFYVFSPRLEEWLEIKPEGVPPEYQAMALLTPTS